MNVPQIQPTLCIWHGGCVDGFTAAWAIRQKWPNCAFHAGTYGEPPPDVTGQHVLLVDFSYPADILTNMAAQAASVTVLDHHKTAKADLKALLDEKVINGRFDMDQSGASLAWQYAWGAYHPLPFIVQYVQDRDLWLWKMDNSGAIHALLASHPFEFDVWTSLGKRIERYDDRLRLIEEGEAILRSQARDREKAVKSTLRSMIIGGVRVPVANVPYFMASDVGGELAAGQPFAATYIDTAEGERQFSLRRRDGEVDVSEIAKAYGQQFGTTGGGHAAAAGFIAPAGWEGDTEESAAIVVATDAGAKIGVEAN